MNGKYLTEQHEDNLDWRDYALALVDEEVVDARELCMMAVKYMTLADVKNMVKMNELDPNTLYDNVYEEIDV